MMRALAAAALVAVLAACGSSPPVRFYTLAAPPAGAAVRDLSGASVAVGPVLLPEQVDRLQWVTTRSANEVRVEEYARWAGPLKGEIARVVAEHLNVEVAGARAAPSASAPPLPDFRVQIDVRRFELAPGRGATLDAVWSLSAAGKPLRTERAVISEPVESADFEALAAAQSRALAQLSRDVAAALRSAR
jgi:uncharacterized lipoprotein YmbA